MTSVRLPESLRERKASGRVDVMAPFLPEGPARVLDFGCGRMAFTRAVAARFPSLSVVGLDLIEPPDAATLPRSVAFRRHTGGRLPFPPGHFDCALAAASLHHTASPEDALSGLVEVTRQGGRIVILDDAFRTPLRAWALTAEHRLRDALLGNATGTLRFLSEDEWQQAFTRLGLRVETAAWVRPFSYVFAKRLYCLGVAHGSATPRPS